MKPQTLIVLVIMVVCAGGAVVAVNSLQPKEGDKVTIFVPTAELASGATIQETNITEISYPKDLTPENAVLDKTKLLGRVVRYPIAPKQAITESNLAPVGAGAGPQALLTEGMQAITVPITTTGGVAGFIKTGDIVDINVFFRATGEGATSRMQKIQQGAKVIAVNQGMEPAGPGQSQGKQVEMVTFALTPKDAMKVQLASQVGTLTLSLRPLGAESEDLKDTSYTLQELLGDKGEMRKEDTKKAEPEAVFVDPEKAETKQSGALAVLNTFMEKVAKPPVEPVAEKPAEVVKPAEAAPAIVVQETPKVTPVPAKKRKAVRYTDPEGNLLFTVVLDADSKEAAKLKDLTEDYEGKEKTKDKGQ